MNTLRWPEFEHRMSARVAEVVSASPELQEEYKRARRCGTNLWTWFWMLLFSLFLVASFFAFAILQMEDIRHGAPRILLLVSLFMTAMTSFHARGWYERYESPWRLAPVHALPMSDAYACKIIRWDCLWPTFWTLGMCAAGFIALGLYFGHMWIWLLAAVLNGLLALSLSIVAAIHAQRWLRWANHLFSICVLLILIIDYAMTNNHPFLRCSLEACLWLLPAGWLNMTVIQAAFYGQPLWMMVLSVCIGVLAVMAWREQPQMNELLNWSCLEQQREATFDEDDEWLNVPLAQPLDAADMEDYVRRGEWLKPWCGAEPASMERYLLKDLSLHEKTLLEYQIGETPAWVRDQVRIGVLAIIGFMLASLVPSYALLIRVITVVSALAVGLLMPMFGAKGMSARSRNYGVMVAYHALLPVGYWEMYGIDLKMGLRRMLVFLPLGCLMAWMVSAHLDAAYGHSFAYLGKILVFAFLCQPIIFVYSTNDTRNIGFLILFVLSGLCAFAAGLVGIFLAKDFTTFALCALVAGAASFGTCAAYGWCYNRMVFDLMRPARKDEL